MIQLFDVYNQESQDLHYSLTEAGLSDLAVVIEPDGFLPDGVVSPFTYYLGYDSGKPLYFNQVPVPDFWEIAGNNQFGTINDLNQERAVIHFADSLQARLVKKSNGKHQQVGSFKWITTTVLELALLRLPLMLLVKLS